nr:hypothetical protein [Escherichia coli]
MPYIGLTGNYRYYSFVRGGISNIADGRRHRIMMSITTMRKGSSIVAM